MSVDLGAWLEDFRRLHEQARRGGLTGTARHAYREARDELASALLRAQHVEIDPRAAPRRWLSVARMLQADLGFFDGTLRVGTRSISCRGFAVVLVRAPRRDEAVRVTLRLPGGDSLQGVARVLDSTPQLGNVLVSFEWAQLSREDAERLELLVFDTVLEQLAS